MLRKLFIPWLFIISCNAWANSSQLKDHPSPYLRLHANDAVRWQVWQPSILELARQENKLIFISVGYFSCHWCHVMRDESFTDVDVAKRLNRDFIPVKVDRELNPALDQQLMTFLQQSRGYGGWPLNIFVTPQGYPLHGLVYSPRDDFISLLDQVSKEWKKDSAKLNQVALDSFEFRRRISSHTLAMPKVEDLSSRLLNRVRMTADDIAGGIGETRKFPREALLLALLEMHSNKPRDWLAEWLQLTLDQMTSRGLHDTVGGGFFRYTVDPGWEIPHFEKMLYTNAAMVLVYIKAYEVFNKDSYLAVARETADFVLRELAMPDGVYASALSAQDSQGREGGSYLWTQNKLADELTAEQWQTINRHWLLTRIDDAVLPMGLALGEDWAAIRQKLMKQRQHNPSPMDDKVLASWNGYFLSALSRLVEITGDEVYKSKGRTLYQYLYHRMSQGLMRESQWESSRYLEDFAFVAQGLLDWEARVVKRKPSKKIVDSVIEAVQLFVHNSGWRLSDGQLLPSVSAPLNLADAQLPSPEVVLKQLVRRLSLQSHKQVKVKMSSVSQQIDSEFIASILNYASHVAYHMELQKAQPQP